jgi:hypothetical protein
MSFALACIPAWCFSGLSDLPINGEARTAPESSFFPPQLFRSECAWDGHDVGTMTTQQVPLPIRRFAAMQHGAIQFKPACYSSAGALTL